MQTNDRRGFEPVPDDVKNQLDELGRKVTVIEHEKVKEILQACPRPTLYVGEIVDVKGMRFEVLRIKADGKIGLKMIPEPRP